MSLTGCALVQKTGEMLGDDDLVKASSEMTPRQEYFLGRAACAKILSNQKIHSSQELNSYINTLGQFLVVHSSRPFVYKSYQFAVLEDQTPAAFSAPGGFVFVSKGLLDKAKTEDEIAAVLAHEISHVVLKHANVAIKNKSALKSVSKIGSFVASFVTDGAVDAEDGEMFTEFVTGVADITFGKDQEMAADKEAINILINAGYDPSLLSSILESIDSQAGFLSKHPRSESRMNAIKEELAQKQFAKNSSDRQKRFEKYKKLL